MSFTLNHSTSPSSNKPKLLLEYWMSSPEISDIEISQPRPVSRGEVYIIHEMKCVDSVLSGKQNTGFVDTHLHHYGLTESSMYSTSSALIFSINRIVVCRSS